MLTHHHLIAPLALKSRPYIAQTTYNDTFTPNNAERFARTFFLHQLKDSYDPIDGRKIPRCIPGESLINRSKELPYTWNSQRDTRLLQPANPDRVREHMYFLPQVRRYMKKEVDLARLKSLDQEARDTFAKDRVWLSEYSLANRDCVPPLKKVYTETTMEKRADPVKLRPRRYHDLRADWQGANNQCRWLSRGAIQGPPQYVRPPRDDVEMNKRLAKENEQKNKWVKFWLDTDQLQRPYIRPLPKYGGHLPRGGITQIVKGPKTDSMTSVHDVSYSGHPNSAFPKTKPRISWFKRH